MNTQTLLYSLPLLGLLGLVYVMWKSAWISSQDAGTDKMKKIAGHIAEGAMAFLKAEYKVLIDRKSTRLNSSHVALSRMPSSA